MSCKQTGNTHEGQLAASDVDYLRAPKPGGSGGIQATSDQNWASVADAGPISIRCGTVSWQDDIGNQQGSAHCLETLNYYLYPVLPALVPHVIIETPQTRCGFALISPVF